MTSANSTSSQKLIVVIGMHRTGTSLVTRGLQALGVSLGDNLLPAMEDVNAKGFWEDAEVNALNIEMLHTLGMEWDSIMPIVNLDVALLERKGYVLRAIELLRNRVQRFGLFGLKDPRIAKLIPFWDKVLVAAGFEPCYLMTIRNPLSVVKSLEKRDGLEPEKSYLIWLTNVLSALSVLNSRVSALTDYDLFMAAPRVELERISAAFSLPLIEQELDEFLRKFVDHNLRHAYFQLSDLDLDPACTLLVKEVYGELLDVAANRKTLKQLEERLPKWFSGFMVSETIYRLLDKLYLERQSTRLNVEVQSSRINQQSGIIENLERFNKERAEQVSSLYAELESLESVRSSQVAQLNTALEELESVRKEQILKLEQALVDIERVRVEQLNSLNEEYVRHLNHKNEELQKSEVLRSSLEGQLQTAHLNLMEHLAKLEHLRAREIELTQYIEDANKHFSSELEKRDGHVMLLSEQLQIAHANLMQHISTIEALRFNKQYLENYIEMILRSRSWKITRPMRVVTRLLSEGFGEADKQELLIRLRKINHKLPVPLQNFTRALARKLLPKLQFAQLPQQAVMVTSSSAEVPLTKNSALTALAAEIAAPSEHDMFVWGVIDWHFRHQRPQQIAQALAQEGDRVFYISSNLIQSDSPGYAVEALDESGCLFQINLCVKSPVPIYHHAPSAELLTDLRASLGALLLWTGAPFTINIVQHPFWRLVAESIPNSRLVYDCMDHHEGFENTGSEIIDLERALFKAADLTIVTSSWLDETIAKYTDRRVLIRNAGEYEYFSKSPATIFAAPKGQKIIGYYGAIAEWFDIDLVAQLAKTYSDALVLLIGADTVNAQKALADFDNVHFVGEVPYKELTHYLYAFDVCLLPFKVIPLILATNPVKVYEYLGAGKPVVAVDVPEIQQFGDLVLVGKDQKDFVTKVGEALAENQTANLIDARKKFASEQTWHHRAKAVEVAVKELVPAKKVSVILVTYNNLDLTKACLYSLDTFTQYENLEIIVVDNASADGTPDFLSEWVKGNSNRKIVLSPENTGFAAGNNMGLKIATGDYLILLNNDTYVTPGWISGLLKHLEQDQSIGLIGPVTNNIGNESRINISYNNMEEMHLAARDFTLRHLGQLTPLRTAAFFCVMMSRATFEKVGYLDEAFGIGFFEDDDYCRRIEQAGLKVMCADDVFIHHHLSASFNKLKVEARQKLFEVNKAVYEKKWGEWIPHKYRPGVF